MSNSDQATPSSTRAKLALTLAALWVAAGALFKLFAGTPGDLPPTVQEFPLLPPTFSFRLAIGVELSIVIPAVCRPRLGARLLMLLFLIFDALLWQMIQGGDASCGCFGSKVPIKPWQMMAIDSVLLLMLLFSGAWGAFAPRPLAIVRLLPLMAVVLVYPWFKFTAAEITRVTDEETGEQTVTIEGDWHRFEPATWEGQMIHDTDLAGFFDPPEAVDLIPPPAHVIVYRLSCEHCKEHFEGLMLEPINDRPLVLIRVPDNEGIEEADVISEVKPEALLEIELKTLPRGYGITTPVMFDVDELFTVQGVLQHADDE